MNRLNLSIATLVLVALTAWGGYRYLVNGGAVASSPGAIGYRTGQISRGDIVRTVSAAGRLDAVVTVKVSSQLSGQISELLVDFNDVVREGQALARLDPVTFEAKIAEAEARLANARALLAEARAGLPGVEARLTQVQSELRRKQILRRRGVASVRDVEAAEAAVRSVSSDVAAAEARVEVREAEVAIAAAGLRQAQIDLERTTIRAPIDGIVVERSVELGQTVAATLQAPTLFTIAQDLGQMELKALVDEADIGAIRRGQRVAFRVDAFPTRTFDGQVISVRQAPEVVENVTTYTVVISAANPDQVLLPGMTATARIIVAEQRGVLRVPNGALRFDPNRLAGERGRPARQRGGEGVIWIVDGGDLVPIEVATGVRDDLHTEITSGTVEAGQILAVGYRDRPAGR